MISPDVPFSDLEGFFEEADEHLQGITRLLLEFEQRYSGAGKERPLSALEKAQQVEKINTLFRSFHTLKGLCGMVGLSAGAELSHAMESILRGIRDQQVPFTPELIGALIEGVKRLTVVIASLRNPSTPPPAIEDILHTLQALHQPKKSPQKRPVEPKELPTSPEPQGNAMEKLLASLTNLEKDLLEEMKRAGLLIGVVVYDPSRQPVQGSRVNQIRTYLDEHGKIIKAQPLIENQVVRFAFLWAGDAMPASPDLPPWSGHRCGSPRRRLPPLVLFPPPRIKPLRQCLPLMSRRRHHPPR